jgi:hypothetical protein
MEVMICIVITLMVSLGTIGAIIFTRQSMELDKQTIAAVNYCRQMMEHISRENPQAYAGTRSLVPFNTPGRDIPATITVAYYPIKADGTVNWDEPQDAPSNVEPFYARVTVRWESTGQWTRPREVSMQTIVSSGI